MSDENPPQNTRSVLIHEALRVLAERLPFTLHEFAVEHGPFIPAAPFLGELVIHTCDDVEKLLNLADRFRAVNMRRDDPHVARIYRHLRKSVQVLRLAVSPLVARLDAEEDQVRDWIKAATKTLQRTRTQTEKNRNGL